MKILFILTISFTFILADVLKFGVISTINIEITKKKLNPLIKYLEKETGYDIKFCSGRNYKDTIEKFSNGTYDFGYIGPVPYILANKEHKNLNILAGIENNNKPYIHSVIVVKKGSKITSIEDLINKNIAFGSPNSTLSYYVPKYMLIKKGIASKINNEFFLKTHDRVAEYVIMGRYEAGGIKQEIADLYSKYLDVIATSESVCDFSIVAQKTMNPKLQQTIKQALLTLKDKKILSSIKKTATGFGLRQDSDYDNLISIMKTVDKF